VSIVLKQRSNETTNQNVKEVSVRSTQQHVNLIGFMVFKRHFQQYFSYIVVSFIGGRKRRTRRKPPTCRKSL